MSKRDEGTQKEQLTLAEKRLLLTLDQWEAETAEPAAIAETDAFESLVEVMNAAAWLQSKGLVRTQERLETTYELDKEGEEYAEDGLPERTLYDHLAAQPEQKRPIAELHAEGVLDKRLLGMAIGNLKALGATIERGALTVDETVGEQLAEAEAFLAKFADADAGALKKDALDEQWLEFFERRKNIVKRHERVKRDLILREEGEALVAAGLEEHEEVAQLTPELLQSGRWQEVRFRPYDIHRFAPGVHGAKPHPLRALMRRIRQTFIAMGFTEICGDYVESCFWNMDALFIPQDHPARELQDTFYLDEPATVGIAPEDEALAKTIAAVHRDGGETQSAGWGYEWSRSEAERALLRTHTTVDTIRYLSEHPEPPQKVFSIGRVFRKETLDSTHLPEFHQIEGIVLEREASFCMLIGILKAFYHKIGFEDVRVRPAYYPYTEPSMDVEAKFKGDWLELGGSGIFRPEVTEPHGIEYPVLAWGLGLERLAMLLYDLDDIRQLYISDLDWLRHCPLL